MRRGLRDHHLWFYDQTRGAGGREKVVKWGPTKYYFHDQYIGGEGEKWTKKGINCLLNYEQHCGGEKWEGEKGANPILPL